jgi:ubiquinone/menaquinone biosynthesis C-methylase UbiE
VYRRTYYEDRLSADKLLRCYEIATPRIKQYLDAEIEFVISNVRGADLVLELGCGYGRVLRAVSPFVSKIVGNDISRASLELARLYMKPYANYRLIQMDASNMAFHSCLFDAVFCVQNGISAFAVDEKRLIGESVRVTKNNGVILFSSYSPKIWQERINWFRAQSREGLIGRIDEEQTRNGTIVCKDGFIAITVTGRQFVKLFEEFRLDASIIEIDGSSVFCRVTKHKNCRIG